MFKPMILGAAALAEAGCAGAGAGAGSGSGSGSGSAAAPADPAALQRAVFAAERSFARSMAERDHAAFSRHRSKQAVFFGAPVC